MLGNMVKSVYHGYYLNKISFAASLYVLYWTEVNNLIKRYAVLSHYFLTANFTDKLTREMLCRLSQLSLSRRHHYILSLW